MHAIMKFRMRRRDRYECDVPHPLTLDGKYHIFCSREKKKQKKKNKKQKKNKAKFTKSASTMICKILLCSHWKTIGILRHLRFSANGLKVDR